MRTIGAGNSAQPTSSLTDFTDAVKIEVANASDVLVDLSDFAVSFEYTSGADDLVDDATVVFRRLDGGSSLAPLMTASPPVDLGRRIVVSINPGSGTYKEVFRGKITDVDWPERDGDVICQCLDQGRDAARTWIETAREYGSTTGVSLETVMQSVATDNMASAPTLYFPTATGAVVQHVAGDAPYGPTEQSVLDAERALAESYGGTIRWRYIDSLSAWRWTVFTPSRSKTVPDHTFGTSDYFDVKQIKLSDADIRNVIEVEYIGDGGAKESVVVLDLASIAAYGRLYGKISEGSDSPVNNSTLGTALGNAALSDLKDPDVLLEIACRYFWPGEIGVDLYRFTANGRHFSTDQDLAPMQFRHRIAVGESPTTHVMVRGKPSGGVLSWRRRVHGISPGDAADINGWIVEEVAHDSATARREEEKVRAKRQAGVDFSEQAYSPAPVYDAAGENVLLNPSTSRIGATAKYATGETIDARADAGLTSSGDVNRDVPLAKAVANVPGIDLSSGKVDKGTAYDTGEAQAGARDVARGSGSGVAAGSREEQTRAGRGGVEFTGQAFDTNPWYDDTGETLLLDPTNETLTCRKMLGGGPAPTVALNISTDIIGAASTATIAGKDTAGSVTVTNSGAVTNPPANGFGPGLLIATITFGTAYSAAPYGIVIPRNQATAANFGASEEPSVFYMTTTTTAGEIRYGGKTTAGIGAGPFEWSYHIIG